jgi:hypothetical protein
MTEVTQVSARKAHELGDESDATLWLRFAEADPSAQEDFAQSWLALQCRLLPGVHVGMVLIGSAPGVAYRSVIEPASRADASPWLREVADRCLEERRGLVEPVEADGAAFVVIGYPVEVRRDLLGAVVLALSPASKSHLQDAFRRLHWGIGWLQALLLQSTQPRLEGLEQQRLALMVEQVACVVEEPRFQTAALAFVTELSTALACDRVTLGLRKGHRLKVQAISHTASFGKHMNLVRAIEAAMEEAFDQQGVVRLPQDPDGIPLVTRAHATLLAEHGAGAACSVPFAVDGDFAGAICLERNDARPFTADEAAVVEGVGELVGPILISKRRDDRWLVHKAFDSARLHLGRLLGPRRLGYKLTALLLAAVLAFALLARGQYRVGADALLEGAVQRVIVAPQQGYIASAAVRAGDLVERDMVMASLDERDLELERLKFASEREQALKEYREALAGRDRARVKILDAQVRQAEAQLELTEDRLERLTLEAPFDGVVVSGDLSQSLGAAVERGEVLFEVAPLDVYRVVLQVDERQIVDVQLGQRGELALTGRPTEQHAFTVEKITPVATAEEGRNYFRVEARLDDAPEFLRPGMQGVGKIDIDRRRLVWIWTRELGNWLALKLWAWLP